MPYRDDEDEPELDDSELPDEAEDADDEDATSLVPCPYCGREIAEEAELCPFCRSFISREDAPAPHRPRWVIFGLILCALVFLTWLAEDLHLTHLFK